MAGALAFALSIVLTPITLLVLHRLSVLDHPNERSSHDEPVVRGGGIAFALACTGAFLLAGRPIAGVSIGVIVAAAALGTIGLAEDLWGVPTGPRFMLQIGAAAAALVWLLSGLSGPLVWQVAFGMGCLLALASYANAFNFMDGINGISAVQSLLAGATWAWLGHRFDADVLLWGGLALAGAALGFLPYNFPNAKLFLGDSGSYFIGGWQAALVIVGLRHGLPPEAVGAPLAIYLADTGTTLIRRVAAGDVWHQPHREHAYQRLIRQGWTHVQTTALVGIFVAACSALGHVATSRPLLRTIADALQVLVVLLYLALPRLTQRNPQLSPTVT
jgi:UDP-GlcNAc:undecaprenyl-phosphate/decaprenyl-phosphate GlcNAc-1-phosphate transferase